MGQFAHHQVDADGVPTLQRQDDVEDSKRARSGLSLSYRVVLQALGLVAPRVHTGHAIVRLGQNCLDLLVPVACQDGAEKVVSIYRGSENTWEEQMNRRRKLQSQLGNKVVIHIKHTLLINNPTLNMITQWPTNEDDNEFINKYNDMNETAPHHRMIHEQIMLPVLGS